MNLPRDGGNRKIANDEQKSSSSGKNNNKAGKPDEIDHNQIAENLNNPRLSNEEFRKVIDSLAI